MTIIRVSLARALPSERCRPNLPDLPSFHHPAEQCSCREADGECRCNTQDRVSLDALRCVVHELFGSVATLFCRTLYYSDATFDCVSNCAGGSRSLVSRFGDVFSGSVQYRL
jgi:hypothetical protein